MLLPLRRARARARLHLEVALPSARRYALGVLMCVLQHCEGALPEPTSPDGSGMLQVSTLDAARLSLRNWSESVLQSHVLACPSASNLEIANPSSPRAQYEHLAAMCLVRAPSERPSAAYACERLSALASELCF